MIPHAFILARPYDLPIARLSRDRLERQGWLASILLDPREWREFPPDALPADYWTEGRGMFGIPCALAILKAIVRYSDRAVVAKFDCDIRLTFSASWFFQRATTEARCTRLGPAPWGGCWAAPRQQVAAAAEWLATAPPCRCPESSLTLKAFRRVGTLAAPPDLHAEKWLPSRPWPALAGAVTLPTVCREKSRRECAADMFSKA